MSKAQDIAQALLRTDERKEGVAHDHPKGSLIYCCDGSEAGIVTGHYYSCRMAGCMGQGVEVKWSDGKKTRPCSRGLEFDKELKAWRIG